MNVISHQEKEKNEETKKGRRKEKVKLTCPSRSHFQRTQSKERWSQVWDERYCSSREGDEEGLEKRKSENRRPILEKLCAALLRSFRGQHSEKMKQSAWGNWDLRKVQQAFRPNPNGVGDRTTTLRRLLIGADIRSIFAQVI